MLCVFWAAIYFTNHWKGNKLSKKKHVFMGIFFYFFCIYEAYKIFEIHYFITSASSSENEWLFYFHAMLLRMVA